MAEATEGTTDFKSGAEAAKSQAVLNRLRKAEDTVADALAPKKGAKDFGAEPRQGARAIDRYEQEKTQEPAQETADDLLNVDEVIEAKGLDPESFVPEDETLVAPRERSVSMLNAYYENLARQGKIGPEEVISVQKMIEGSSDAELSDMVEKAGAGHLQTNEFGEAFGEESRPAAEVEDIEPLQGKALRQHRRKMRMDGMGAGPIETDDPEAAAAIAPSIVEDDEDDATVIEGDPTVDPESLTDEEFFERYGASRQEMEASDEEVLDRGPNSVVTAAGPLEIGPPPEDDGFEVVDRGPNSVVEAGPIEIGPPIEKDEAPSFNHPEYNPQDFGRQGLFAGGMLGRIRGQRRKVNQMARAAQTKEELAQVQGEMDKLNELRELRQSKRGLRRAARGRRPNVFRDLTEDAAAKAMETEAETDEATGPEAGSKFSGGGGYEYEFTEDGVMVSGGPNDMSPKLVSKDDDMYGSIVAESGGKAPAGGGGGGGETELTEGGGTGLEVDEETGEVTDTDQTSAPEMTPTEKLFAEADAKYEAARTEPEGEKHARLEKEYGKLLDESYDRAERSVLPESMVGSPVARGAKGIAKFMGGEDEAMRKFGTTVDAKRLAQASRVMDKNTGEIDKAQLMQAMRDGALSSNQVALIMRHYDVGDRPKGDPSRDELQKFILGRL